MCVLQFSQFFAVAGVFEFVVREEVPNSKPIWVCRVCNFQALRKNHTVEHFLYKHAPDENLPCDYCGKVFNKRPTLRKHLIKCKRRYAQGQAAGAAAVAAASPNVTVANPLMAGVRGGNQGKQGAAPGAVLMVPPNVTLISRSNPLLGVVGGQTTASQAAPPPPNVTITNPLLVGPAAGVVPKQEMDPNTTLTHVPNPLLQ